MGFLKKLGHGKLEPLAWVVCGALGRVEYTLYCGYWRLKGKKKPTKQEVESVCQNVTFLFKSFQRQRMAKQLYRNIQSYYPGAKVVIVDDSQKPLKLEGEGLTVVQLPFDSGLSYGLNRGLEQVKTPYVVRLDDDMLLTPCFQLTEELRFLENHPEVDLAGFCWIASPKFQYTGRSLKAYGKERILWGNQPFRIPHMTMIDKTHMVVEKPMNMFLVRTDKLRLVGWDDRIRMIDHHEFFVRAAGKLVCVAAPNTVVFHRHNPFHRSYMKYRNDYLGDRAYIRQKYAGKQPGSGENHG